MLSPIFTLKPLKRTQHAGIQYDLQLSKLFQKEKCREREREKGVKKMHETKIFN